jgi:hypothetical protein
MRIVGSVSSWRVVAVAALSLSVFAPGCKSRRNVAPNDVQVTFEVSRPRAPLGSAVEVTYTWTVGPAFQALSEDYRAFVHFLDSHNEILFDDDHAPVPPPKTWTPGQTYKYTRTLFVPVYPYVGEAQIVMGLYPPAGKGDRVALKGEDTGLRAYKAGKVELLPQTENIFVIYKDGWHGAEAAPNNPGQERIWTKKDAMVSFKNPKEDIVVYLEADTNYQAFSQPPVLTMSVGTGAGVVLPIENSEMFLKKVRFKAADLGTEEYVDLRLSMSESFVPKAKGLNQDERELSLLVYHLFVGEAERLGSLGTTTVVDAAVLPPPGRSGVAKAAASAPAVAPKKTES